MQLIHKSIRNNNKIPVTNAESFPIASEPLSPLLNSYVWQKKLDYSAPKNVPRGTFLSQALPIHVPRVPLSLSFSRSEPIDAPLLAASTVPEKEKESKRERDGARDTLIIENEDSANFRYRVAAAQARLSLSLSLSQRCTSGEMIIFHN